MEAADPIYLLAMQKACSANSILSFREGVQKSLLAFMPLLSSSWMGGLYGRLPPTKHEQMDVCSPEITNFAVMALTQGHQDYRTTY
jgi:hypothetical protein